MLLKTTTNSVIEEVVVVEEVAVAVVIAIVPKLVVIAAISAVAVVVARVENSLLMTLTSQLCESISQSLLKVRVKYLSPYVVLCFLTVRAY